MSIQLQLKRGTATQHETFTGADGEVTVNTTTKSLHVHDGVTAGGSALATQDYVDTVVGKSESFIEITKSLSLIQDWIDTGIKHTDLATGTYIIQVYANDVSAGGGNNNEYYSGTMSWYAGDTSSTTELPSDEIVLHRAGGSSEGNIYLRTYKSNGADKLKLQIYSNHINASAANYVFRFRRMI